MVAQLSELRFDIQEFRLDKEAKAGGVWIDFGGGAQFKIAAFDNPGFSDAFRKATKPYNDLGKEIPDADQIEIMSRTMSQFIVLDWKGVFDGKKKLQYSQENAFRLLFELEWIRAKIIAEAQKLENFRAKVKEATAGN